jgi:hypothetical protein
MNKLGKFELNAWTVLGGVVVAYIVLAPFRAWVDGLLGGLGGGAPAPGRPVIECIYDGAVMTVGPVEKKYAPTTALTSIGTRLVINGQDRGMFTDKSTVDVTYKDDIAAYYASNYSTSATDFYYAAEQKFTVPCVSTLSSADATLDPSGAIELILAEKPTIALFNNDDGLKNSKTQNETIAAADSTDIEMKITQSSKSGYSSYGKQIIGLQMNTTLWDITKVDLTAISGVASVTPVSCPTYLSNYNSKVGARAGFGLVCYAIPGVQSESTTVQVLNLHAETKSGVDVSNLAVGSPGASWGHNQINISIVDENWYRNSVSGAMEFGAETDTNGNVGSGGYANATLYVVG